MSNMKRLLDDIIADYESDVFTLEQLAEKYNMKTIEIIGIIDTYLGFDD